MAQRVLVECFYDVVSPYSWVGFEIATRYAALYPDSFKLVLKPFFLGGVMQTTGNQPPAMLPARGAYLMKDIARVFQWAGLRGQTPSRFPASTLKAQRVLAAISKSGSQEQLASVSRRMWVGYWGSDQDITDENTLKNMIKAGAPDLNAETLLRSAQDQEVKDLLKQNTESAIARGAYGSPVFFVHAGSDKEEMYFGSDRFHIMFPSIGVTWHGPMPDSPVSRL